MMLKWILIAYFWLQIKHIDLCTGYSRSTRGPISYGYEGHKFLDIVLFVRNSTMPKSYVVGFKYVGDPYSTVLYSGSIHSDAPNTTNGHGELSNGRDIKNFHHLNAEIHIPNATNFQVDVQVRGMMGLGYIGSNRLMRFKTFHPRSSALICAINESQPKSIYRQLIFGARKDGDAILHARKEIFSLTGKELPRYTFEFEGDVDAIITAAVIRLNSTRAIVFHNKVELTKHRFSATIYGRSQDTIAGALIIYGHDHRISSNGIKNFSFQDNEFVRVKCCV